MNLTCDGEAYQESAADSKISTECLKEAKARHSKDEVKEENYELEPVRLLKLENNI